MADSGKKNVKMPSPIRLVDDQVVAPAPEPSIHWDASDLAKAATDVIAWNRQSTASSVRASTEESETRAPRVASLGSLRCGLKIRKEEAPAETPSAAIRSLVKE